MRLRLTEISNSFSAERFTYAIASAEIVETLIPDDAYNVVNSYIDVTQSLLEISWIAESIASSAQIISGNWVEREPCFRDFLIIFHPVNISGLSEFLFRYSKFYGKDAEQEEQDRNWYMEQIDIYELNLDYAKPHFHDLLDSYYVNLIGGAYCEMADNCYNGKKKFYKKEFKKWPERKYSFWKSAFSLKHGVALYMTLEPGPWVLPVGADVNTVVKAYFGEDQRTWRFEQADIIEHKGMKVVLNSQKSIWFDGDDELINAKKLVPKVTADGQWFFKTRKTRDEDKYFLSEFGDLLVIQDNVFSYVFFLDGALLKYADIIELKDKTDSRLLKMEQLIGVGRSINIDWNTINDNLFEELCYDIIYDNTKFDRTTIRKMGNSRSRDGGRDIAVYTYADIVNGRPAELFIFQCKFIKRKSSLTGSKMPGLANTIMQYGAKGYGVFTTGVIDSTLYDMLEGIQNNCGVSTRENWSIYEIERYLERNKPLMDKFFPDTGT